MFQNYLKVALRNLRKYKGYSFINILGLAVGMACCFLIMLYVRFELSYEDFHANKNQIYRVIPRWMNNGVEMAQVWTPTGLAPDVAAQFSEIKTAARYTSWDGEALMRHGERVLPRERLALADQAFLEIFSFELIKGNPQTALQAPFAMVISESIAKSAFADEEPLGKIIRFDDKHDFIVTGVFKDIPANSHLQFSYLASFVTLKNFMAEYGAAEHVLENYSSWNYSTYLWIPRPIDHKDFERRMTAFVEEKSGNKSRTTTFTLQPLADIHFTQGLRGDSANGDITYVYAFSGVAAFILLIACFNFMNLATARALNRTKEVGVRKVVGAFRWQLMTQFLFETILLNLVALGLGFCLLELVMLPAFKEIVGTDISFAYADHLPLATAMICAGILTGILAGGYPAFYLSSFAPVKILKSNTPAGGKSKMRKFLTVLQFGIASFLIIGTIVVVGQMNFMKSSKLGFQKEQVVCLEPPREILRGYDTFKQNLLRHSSITSMTIANGVPGRMYSHYPYRFRNNDGEETTVSINTLILDYDYLDVLSLQIAEGRNLSRDIASDSTGNYLINEAAARELGMVNPVGMDLQVINRQRQKGKIVGVIKDFHYASLHRRIEPLAMWIGSGEYWLVALRISSGNISQTLKVVEQEWSRLAPAFPFAYKFLDEDFDRLYKSEQKLSAVLGAFSGLAVFIACLGLLGLSSFIAEQRTKEVGIRKVLGASVRDIIVLFSQDFLKLVALAFIIACPIAYWAMSRWLQDFAYRMELGFEVFALAGSFAFFSALVTLSYKAIKAALANPVEALRYE